MAIRSLADDSRALSLMSRYEARRQRVHDKGLRHSPGAGSPSVSAGASPEPDPAPSVEKEKVPSEPTAPPPSSPNIHLCTPAGQVPDLPRPPETENSEDRDT